jgi:NitT/TauT family transport system permease protein
VILRAGGVQLLSICALLGLWTLGAWLANSNLLPDPLSVAKVLAREVADGELPYHLAITLTRVSVTFFIAMTVGTAVGIAMGRSRLTNDLLDPWLIFLLNVPALVIIILAYVWFGLVESAAIFAVALNKIPNVIVTQREGSRALDRDYLEMAEIYRLGRLKTLRYVILPQLAPFLTASARSGLALIWKIVLVVELLGRSNGMGFQLHLFFQLFDVAAILAYSLAFIVVIQIIETTLLQPFERRLNRWRR